MQLCTCLLLTNDGRFKVNKHSSWNALSCSRLAEEGGKGVCGGGGGLIGRNVSIWLNAMLQTVQFPAGIAYLDASLTQVDANALPLEENNGHCFISQFKTNGYGDE